MFSGALLFKRLALLLFSLALVVVLGEVVARAYWTELVGADFERPPPELPAGVSLEALPELTRVRELNQPNQQGLHNGVYFRTNSHRMRGPELERRAAPGVLRIAVLGDSVTMGSGVQEELTYAARLGPLLEAALPGLEVEVLNAGMSGLDARRIMGRRDAVVRLYAPHVLVYGHTLNDIEGREYERVVAEQQTGEFWQFARRGAESPSYLWRLVWIRVIALAAANAPWLESYRSEIVHNYVDNRHARSALMYQLKHLAERQGKPHPCALVFTHTRLEQLEDDHPYLELYELVEKISDALEVPVAHSFPMFLGQRAETLWVAPFDPHPNEAGHALLAEALVDGLLTLPPACLSPVVKRKGRRHAAGARPAAAGRPLPDPPVAEPPSLEEQSTN